MVDTSDPFGLLLSLERRSKGNAAGLPAQEEAVEHWNGIGFSLGGLQFVAAMGDVVEILHIPRYTIIPGVKSWMQGVANVRGRLLPVMDLNSFFKFSGPKAAHRDRRVLVIDREDVFSGLVVDAVLGMQYFTVDAFTSGADEQVENVQRFIRGYYVRGNQRWYVFDVNALIADPGFLDVAM